MTLAQLQAVQTEKKVRAQIEDFHAEYCRLTKLNLPLKRCLGDGSREQGWYEFIKHGFTKDDLAAVIAFRRRRIKEGRRYPESLMFRNLIGNLDYFGEDLAEARAVAREPRIDHERKFVLESTGRSAEPERAPVMTAGQVIKESKKLADMLREWRLKNLTEEEPDATV